MARFFCIFHALSFEGNFFRLEVPFKLYKVCNIYPRSIKSLLRIVLIYIVTNLTKVL